MAKPPVRDTQDSLRAETEGDAEKLVFRAKGVHAICMNRKHRWPELDLNPASDKLPRGFMVGPIRIDGLLDITEQCLRGCGETRTYLARPDDVFGFGIRKNYHRPKDRPVLARDIPRDIWAAPLQQALVGRIMAAARRATEQADRAMRERELD
jgi:hypothetical protein